MSKMKTLREDFERYTEMKRIDEEVGREYEESNEVYGEFDERGNLIIGFGVNVEIIIE